jgi:hypothetical protein
MLNSEQEEVWKTPTIKSEQWWTQGNHKHKSRVLSIVQMVLLKKKILFYCSIPCGNSGVIDYKLLKRR